MGEPWHVTPLLIERLKDRQCFVDFSYLSQLSGPTDLRSFSVRLLLTRRSLLAEDWQATQDRNDEAQKGSAPENPGIERHGTIDSVKQVYRYRPVHASMIKKKGAEFRLPLAIDTED